MKTKKLSDTVSGSAGFNIVTMILETTRTVYDIHKPCLMTLQYFIFEFNTYYFNGIVKEINIK